MSASLGHSAVAYLAQREISIVEFFSNMISKYCLFYIEWMAASPDPTSSANNDDEPAWKKVKQEMIAEHINVRSSADRELQHIVVFRLPLMICLPWWKRQADSEFVVVSLHTRNCGDDLV